MQTPSCFTHRAFLRRALAAGALPLIDPGRVWGGPMPGSTLPPSVRAGAVRPYPPAYGPFYWRDWWDFGASGLAHMGIYNLAPVFDALRPGPPLEWDPENHCIPNQPGADRYLHYEYRRFGHFEPVNRVVDRSTVRRQMSDRADLPEMPD